MTRRMIGNRLASVTVPMTLGAGDGGAGHVLAVSLAYARVTPDGLADLREVAFVTRGKIGHGMDDMLTELGIKLSRAIQGRDPETGAIP